MSRSGPLRPRILLTVIDLSRNHCATGSHLLCSRPKVEEHGHIHRINDIASPGQEMRIDRHCSSIGAKPCSHHPGVGKSADYRPNQLEPRRSIGRTATHVPAAVCAVMKTTSRNFALSVRLFTSQ